MNTVGPVLSTSRLLSRKHPRDETEYDCTSLEDNDSVYMDMDMEEELLGRSIKMVKLSHSHSFSDFEAKVEGSCAAEITDATSSNNRNCSDMIIYCDNEDDNEVVKSSERSHESEVSGCNNDDNECSIGSTRSAYHENSGIEVLPRVGGDGDPIEPVDYSAVNQLLRQLAYMRIERSQRSSETVIPPASLSESPYSSVRDSRTRSHPGNRDMKYS